MTIERTLFPGPSSAAPTTICIECGAALEPFDIEIQAETCATCWRMWYFGEPRVIAAARAILYGCADDDTPHGWSD